MKAIKNWENIEASTGSFENLPAGAYICRITAVEDFPDKEYLKIKYDIADGKYKNWWSDVAERAGFWGGTFIRSYKEKALGMLKGFTNAVEETNDGYSWDWNEKRLVGKFIGLELNYEEYLSKTNELKTRVYVQSCVNGKDVRAGKFNGKTYKVKPLSKKDSDKLDATTDALADFEEVESTDTLPF